MLTTASRVPGRGRLLAAIRVLVHRTERYAAHRARTPDDRQWAAVLADGLDAVYRRGLASASARAGLAAVDARRAARRKTPDPELLSHEGGSSC